jgi:RNA polymerase sigma-70 factor (ECF subfamily)
MASDPSDERLSRISTKWGPIRTAHSGPAQEASLAQMWLLKRYFPAINRYLLGALREAGAAEELGQEFAFRFIRGDFQGADPQRGRFRDYLKTVLFRMVANYRKQQMTQPRSLPATYPAPPLAPAEPAEEPDFISIWRRQLINGAWEALAQVQKKTGQPFHAVLQLRVEHPDGEFSSAQMADHLAGRFGRRFTSDGVRKLLQRAREKFADFLLDEVVKSLEKPTPEQLEQELRELNLWVYCRPALLRRGYPSCPAESPV